MALLKYIEGWYNRKRIHGSIGYLTPDTYEFREKQRNFRPINLPFFYVNMGIMKLTPV
ncbi:hypothetical protein CEW92_03840 [Bacillaceae bacterium SAS-127]|nr:hypothetical protein CEW92_03840 [Bacillaceae bacterium SAS-127]